MAKKRFNETEKNLIASRIGEIFDNLDNARKEHNDEIQQLQDKIYTFTDGKQAGGFDYLIPDLYKINDTLSSYINQTIYQNNENIFDVKGQDFESQRNAQKHKFDVVDTLDKMGFKSKMIEAIVQMNLSGELIAFVGINERIKYKKRPKTTAEQLAEKQSGVNLEDIEPFVIEERKIYEGPDIEIIRAQDFVFDTTQKRIFDKAPKIIRKYLTYEEVVNDPAFKISPEDKQYFQNLTLNVEPNQAELTQDQSFWHKRTDMKDGQLEVLEYWGDFVYSDSGETFDLSNYVIAMVAGRIVRIEPNPFFNNPIVYMEIMEEPNYKRGISPLRVALTPQDIKNNVMNKAITLFDLVANAPYFAQKGILEDKEQSITPGKAILWKASANPQGLPQRIDFSGGLTAALPMMQIFDRQIQEATGISDNLSGIIENERRTATEINLAASGGSVRINNLIDKIKSFNLMLVETIADLKANTELNATQVMVKGEDGEFNSLTIEPEVKQGNFEYTYIDTKTALERQARSQELLGLAQVFIEAAPGEIDMKELFKYMVSQLGVQDADKLMQKDPIEQALGQIGQQLNMQPEDKKVIKDRLAQLVPQILQEFTQGATEQAGQGEIPPQALPAL